VFVTFSTEAIVPPAVNEIVDGLKLTEGAFVPAGDTFAERVTVPAKPFLLIIALTRMPLESCGMTRGKGVRISPLISGVELVGGGNSSGR